MFKVIAQARLRKHNGQEFTAYWCAGKRWNALEPTEHELSEDGLASLKDEESNGFPIHLISSEAIQSEESSVPPTEETSQVSSTPPWVTQPQ